MSSADMYVTNSWNYWILKWQCNHICDFIWGKIQ